MQEVEYGASLLGCHGKSQAWEIRDHRYGLVKAEREAEDGKTEL